MKILIVSLFNSWVTHFGAELEIAQRHLDDGDEVEFLGCDGCITYCAANPRGKISKCDRCRLRRREGLKLLSRPVKQHRLGDYLSQNSRELEREIDKSVKDPATAEAFTFGGHDLGAGALSSTIWRARDPLVETEDARGLLVRYTKGAVRAYLATKSFLSAHPGYGKAYVFNGRLGCTRGVYRACREITDMDTITHERGSSIHKFSLFLNSMPHSRAFWHREILRSWDEANDKLACERIAETFYQERRGGVAVAWRSFTKDQDASLHPEHYDPAKTNVVIYNSSEDEFVGLGPEWKNPVYEMQSQAVERIVTEGLERYPNIHFYLRVHPNLTGVTNKDVSALNNLAAKGLSNFTLLSPDSKVSSYTMLDLADKVVSFGSTMGIEATFWGKPSIMAGRCFYDNLGAVYAVSKHDELMELLGLELEAKPKLGALQYGYYARTHGTPFRYWQAKDFSVGTFKGKYLNREPKSAIWSRLKVLSLDMAKSSY